MQQRSSEADPFINKLCIVGNGKACCKELSPRWMYKKATCLWKLVTLVFLGLCGLYVCTLGFEHQRMYHKLQFSTIAMNENKKYCSKISEYSTSSVHLHYPQPVKYDRKECRCTPVHNFIILSMQRSGSGWFETLLNSHSNISSHGEIFSVDARKENISTIKWTLDTVYNLDWFSSASKNECTAAVGFKWMLNQGAMEYKSVVASYLKKKGVSVIFLFRRNLLRRYISILANTFDRDAKQLNGTHQSHVHSEEEASVLAAYKPVVNVTSIVTYLDRITEIMNDAQRSFNDTRHMIVYYEDLVKNKKEMERAQKFLGVPVKQLDSKHVKIHTRPMSGQIENWADISKRLTRTRYRNFLQEDYDIIRLGQGSRIDRAMQAR